MNLMIGEKKSFLRQSMPVRPQERFLDDKPNVPGISPSGAIRERIFKEGNLDNYKTERKGGSSLSLSRSESF